MKRILILTTELTGYGHKTVSDAIEYNFERYKDVEVRCVEAFSFGGKSTVTMSQIYNKSVGVSLSLWKLMYKIAYLSHKTIGVIIGLKIEKKLMKYISDYKPDFILSVHPIFVKSTAFVLKKNKVKIPFGVLVTDIASINNIWLDKKPNFYFCTTKETKDACLRYGILSDNIYMTKYPIGEQYTSRDVLNRIRYSEKKPLSVLVLSGGDGVLDFEGIAKTILTSFKSEVTVVTGRNKKLKDRLESGLGKRYGGRLHIEGFVNNLSELYKSHNIALIRASPNVMFEASTCNIPSIIVSYIPGQETDNCRFAEEHNIAINCYDECSLSQTIDSLIANNGERLREVKRKQREYKNSLIYKDIEDIIYSLST